MASKKVIAVVGATGSQGGGLARAILKDPSREFAVRALTRSPDSAAAMELGAAGADLMQVDIDDPAALRRAFDGAYGAYCVTFYWAHHSPERETAEARSMAEAARDCGLAHVIWSTLEDTRRWIPLSDDRMPTLMDRYKVPHCDAKGEADAFFTQLGVPATFLLTSFYWDNLIAGLAPQRGPDGHLAITLPMGTSKLPGIAAEDIGKCALGVFRAGQPLIGRRLGIAGEQLTGAQMAEVLSRELGQDIRYNAVEPEVFRSFGFPGADDLGNMFQFKRDFERDFCGARDVEFSRKLNPELQSFSEWVAAHREQFPLA